MKKPLWTHTTVEETEHATITTYHLTDEALAMLDTHGARLPAPPPPRQRITWRRILCAFTWHSWKPTLVTGTGKRCVCDFCGTERWLRRR